MRVIPDWWIQTSWWASGIFGTGAVWYFLSTHEYRISIAAGVAAAILALLAIMLHRKKDALHSNITSVPQAPIEKDKVVTSEWWDASALRRDYVSRGLNHFYWSNAERVAEREQKRYEVVYLNDVVANVRFRIVNKSGQILIAMRDA